MLGQIKSNEEIELMKKSGKICATALKKILENVDVGVELLTLNRIANEEIEKQGASASFMTVEDYRFTICTTINEQVVHGIPTNRKLQSGDVLGIDIGALYKGFHSDLAISVGVGDISDDAKVFLDVGKKTLDRALTFAKAGNKIGDISATIQNGVESAGYSIIKNLTGHGVGKKLHEKPLVPGFGKTGTGLTLEENMTIAVEVIYAKGSGEVGLEKDNWTISTLDGSLGGLFEKTIQVTKNGPIVLTPYL